MLGKLLPLPPHDNATRKLADGIEAQRPEGAETDAEGRIRLTVTLPAGREGSIRGPSRALARLIGPVAGPR